MTVSTSAERVVLPSLLVPVRYDLSIEPDLDAFTFKGSVDITFTVDAEKRQAADDAAASEIILHAKELCFESAEYVVDDCIDDGVKADEIHVNVKETTVKFLFGTPIAVAAKQVKLSIHYTGFLNNQMAGFYRSSYQDIYGNTKIMASTQFEALDARRAFPCVDEPARKAVFALTLTIPANRQCLSNMPVQSSVTLPAGTEPPTLTTKKRVTFLDSPNMSTYLLAFLVGEFDSCQAQTDHGVLIQVYTPPGKSASGQFALECATRCLDAYDLFFDQHYPLPKLDMVAIPEFAAGAMENWGLVTYREVDLLIDPITASSQQKQRVATVVTHELAHQWFGNLVTMDWWSGLWLNESFASWCENWATDKLYPEYRMWDQFCTGHMSSALRLDALQSSHPIDVPIKHAEEVEQVFDAISYCKGAAVVRMIKAVLGLQNFQTGLQAYMKEFAFGNTDSSDLFQAWEKASNMPVGELMDCWTHVMGFPMLRVVKEDWQEDEVTLELEQSWFLSDGSPLTTPEAKAKKWTIPILTCTAAGAQEEMTLMREHTATVTIPLDSNSPWAKLNAGQEVPMRVLPTPEMIQRFQVAIQCQSMSAIDRAGLLNDAYALTKAGKMTPETLITLLGYYDQEDDFIVWEGLADVLNGLNSVFSDDEALSANFLKFAKKMVVQIMGKVGWESSSTDGHLTTLLRGLMISLLSSFAHDDETVAKEATTRFAAFSQDATNVTSLPSDMRTQVFKIVLKNGGETEYEAVKSYYYKATDNAERKHVLNSLGSTKDPALKLATMEWTTSGEIKLQDFFYAMGSVGRSSKEGREISWKYYQDNFEKIKGMLGKSNPSLMDACIIMCCGSFCSHEKADEIEAFFQANPLPKNTRKIAQTMENMRANAKFLQVVKSSELSKDEFWANL